MNYEIKAADEVIVDEGRRYAVKAPWTKVDGPGECYATRVVAEGAEDMGGGWYPAEKVEVYRLEDGIWEVCGHWNEEETCDDGGVTGVWMWREQDGVRFLSNDEMVKNLRKV